MYYYINSNELYHHGVLGMKWGIRRYQPYRNGERKGKEVGEAAKAEKKESAKQRLQKTGLLAMSAAVGSITGISLSLLTGNPIIGGTLGVGVAAIGYQQSKADTENAVSKCGDYSVNSGAEFMRNMQRHEAQRFARRSQSFTMSGGTNRYMFR